MSSRLTDLPVNMSGVVCAVTGVIAAILVFSNVARPSKLDAIPTVGSSTWLGSWWAGLKHLSNAMDVIQEGYEKHKSAPFKIATLYHWTVIFSSRDHVEELCRAPNNTLSFTEAINDASHRCLPRLQVEYTMAPEIHRNPYHDSVVHSQLTRNIGALYPEIRNEVIAAFDEILDLKGTEWKNVPALSTVQKVVCRTSNRMFVGLPLCRDPDWIDLNIRYTIDVVKGAAILILFPKLLKPVAARLFTNVHQNKQRGRKLIGPIIEERQNYLNEYGDKWADKPNDFLSWLMEAAEGPELRVESLATRMLVVNAVAIHTASHSFTHALFYLVANPQYIQPLREEVEGIVEKEGWSKAALSKMRKVDSFLKECQRFEGVNCVSLIRKALKDFTFSDGTFVPKGTQIVTAARCVHRDEAVYESALAFDPFRFAHASDEDGDGTKHQYVSTTPEYLPFGLGRRACPGRFFAATELKTMLAHIVMMYDVKLEDDATHPQALHFGTSIVPDPSAKVMFRRRVD
ncbi:cytochrome P450 [Imleria badia]|nr:cytochrome P450 [Imleria badia]